MTWRASGPLGPVQGKEIDASKSFAIGGLWQLDRSPVVKACLASNPMMVPEKYPVRPSDRKIMN
jgi:hypothetical protein